ncbi:MAG TPA: hypothetical protein VG324_15370, partial [Blastocatellia bacterium]|nr:hypothetical protein [Blastocatellia bacterium]
TEKLNKELAKEPGKEPAKEPGKEPAKEPGKEAAQEPGKEPAKPKPADLLKGVLDRLKQKKDKQ